MCVPNERSLIPIVNPGSAFFGFVLNDLTLCNTKFDLRVSVSQCLSIHDTSLAQSVLQPT